MIKKFLDWWKVQPLYIGILFVPLIVLLGLFAFIKHLFTE